MLFSAHVGLLGTMLLSRCRNAMVMILVRIYSWCIDQVIDALAVDIHAFPGSDRAVDWR